MGPSPSPSSSFPPSSFSSPSSPFFLSSSSSSNSPSSPTSLSSSFSSPSSPSFLSSSSSSNSPSSPTSLSPPPFPLTLHFKLADLTGDGVASPSTTVTFLLHRLAVIYSSE
ncbi:hypothetical protein FHG87_021284 [Trinorchestia longiramus]|nr:hypothetical protein FHG87_021284 [Trinorchestia longiramus]